MLQIDQRHPYKLQLQTAIEAPCKTHKEMSHLKFRTVFGAGMNSVLVSIFITVEEGTLPIINDRYIFNKRTRWHAQVAFFKSSGEATAIPTNEWPQSLHDLGNQLVRDALDDVGEIGEKETLRGQFAWHLFKPLTLREMREVGKPQIVNGSSIIIPG